MVDHNFKVFSPIGTGLLELNFEQVPMGSDFCEVIVVVTLVVVVC